MHTLLVLDQVPENSRIRNLKPKSNKPGLINPNPKLDRYMCENKVLLGWIVYFTLKLDIGEMESLSVEL